MSERKRYLGELIAEFIAVMIIIIFGDSVAAMIVLYDPNPYQNAYWGVAIVWGLGVTIAIYATGAVSGTHANPAVTLALALYRGFSWKKVLLLGRTSAWRHCRSSNRLSQFPSRH